MLSFDNKYKEYERVLSLIEKDHGNKLNALELQKQRDINELLKCKNEIKSNVPLKTKRKDYWFRFKLWLWKIFLSMSR